MIELFVLLFLLGVAFILAECLLPGAILGAFGVFLILLSTGGAVLKFPEYAVFIVTGEFTGAVLAFIVGFTFIRKSRLGRALTLNDAQRQDAGWVSNETDASLVGAVGVVYTPLRPVGTVIVRDQRLQAVTQGAYLPKDAQVRVVEVHGNRVVVEQAEQ